VIRVGLIGHPVAHSRSPAMHNAAFAVAGLKGAYEAIDVAPDGLSSVLARCRDAGWRGLNVTIPHKRAVFALCDTVTAAATRAAAVNTLVFSDGQVRGDNTDIAGFVGSVRAVAGFEPSGRSALVLGAGGAARGVVVGLVEAGAEVVVTARRDEASRALAEQLNVAWAPLDDSLADRPVDLLVNATSAGMKAAVESTGWADATAFFGRLPMAAWGTPTTLDLVYTPDTTAFMHWAASQGCPAFGGLDMLARQGALAFEQWTGVAAETVLPAMLGELSS